MSSESTAIGLILRGIDGSGPGCSGLLMIVEDEDIYVMSSDGIWQTIPYSQSISWLVVAVKKRGGIVSWVNGADFISTPAESIDISSEAAPDTEVYIHDRDAGGRIWVYDSNTEGIYYSDDEGQSWTLSTTLISIPTPHEIATHPTDENRIAITYSDNFGNTAIEVTTDRGGSWSNHIIRDFFEPHFGWGSVFVWLPGGRIAVIFTPDIPGPDAVHSTYSDDDGSSWSTPVEEALNPDTVDSFLEFVDMRATAGGYIFVAINRETDNPFVPPPPGTAFSILRSADGATYESLTPHLSGEGEYVRALAFDETTGDLYIAYQSDRIFKVPNAETISAANWLTQAEEIADVPTGAVSSNQGNMVILTSSEAEPFALRTPKALRTITSRPQLKAPVSPKAVMPSFSSLIIPGGSASIGMILRGIEGSGCSLFTLFALGPTFEDGGQVFRYTGLGWELVGNYGDGPEGFQEFGGGLCGSGNEMMLLETGEDIAYYSSNRGATWTTLTTALFDSSDLNLTCDPNGHFWLAFGDNMCKSEDGGQTWEVKYTHSGSSGMSYVAFHPTDQLKMAFAVGEFISSTNCPQFSVVSQDGGETWDTNPIGLSTLNGSVNCLIEWLGDNLVAVCDTNHVGGSFYNDVESARSDDFGVNWTLNGTLLDNYSSSPGRVLRVGNAVFLCMINVYAGPTPVSDSPIVYRTTDTVTWERLTPPPGWEGPLGAFDFHSHRAGGTGPLDGDLVVSLVETGVSLTTRRELWRLADPDTVTVGNEVWTEIDISGVLSSGFLYDFVCVADVV